VPINPGGFSCKKSLHKKVVQYNLLHKFGHGKVFKTETLHGQTYTTVHRNIVKLGTHTHTHGSFGKDMKMNPSHSNSMSEHSN